MKWGSLLRAKEYLVRNTLLFWEMGLFIDRLKKKSHKHAEYKATTSSQLPYRLEPGGRETNKIHLPAPKAH